MVVEDEVTLPQSQKKVTVQTWPMRPALVHAVFATQVLQSLADGLGLTDVSLKKFELPDCTVGELLRTFEHIASTEYGKVFAFIADGVKLSPQEVENLSLQDTLSLAMAVGMLNLRPTPGLLDLLKTTHEKSTALPLK